MEISTTVLTFGQIALGLAGFSAVLIALSGEPSRWSALDSFRISAMLGSSLGALLLSLLPFVLRFLGIDPVQVWRCSAAVAAAVIGVFGVVGALRFQRLQPADRATARPVFVWLLEAVHFLVAVALVAAAVGMLGNAEGVFLLALFCLLTMTSYVIVRFLFARPV